MEWTQTEKAKKPAEKAPAKQQQQPQQKQVNIKDLSVQQLQNVGSKYIMYIINLWSILVRLDH